MTRKQHCSGCIHEKNGVKSRRAFRHTCGKNNLKGSADRHKWIKIEKFKNDYHFYVEKHECKTCGCIRGTYHAFGWKQYDYQRSGQIFSHRPECINWEKENQKTID